MPLGASRAQSVAVLARSLQRGRLADSRQRHCLWLLPLRPRSAALGYGHGRCSHFPTMATSATMTDTELPAKIAAAVALADSDSPAAAIDALLTLERTSRLAEAAPETAAICTELVRLAYSRQGWVALGEMVVLLSKRRSQLKAAVSRSVQEAMTMLKEEKPDEDTQVQLLKTLCDVTSGKIYVEVERASLTRSLAAIYESRGDISTAADLMQELQVETFSAMDRRDKYDFILEQVRLCLDKKDNVRASIMAKKILPRQISKEGLEDIKLRYYALMVRIHVANGDMLEICRAYIARYETTKVTADSAEPWARELRLAAAFVVHSPYGPMQTDLLHRLSGDKALAKLPEYKALLKLFTTSELIRQPMLMSRFGDELRSTISGAMKEDAAGAELDWQEPLTQRVTEHNLRVCALYYTRIPLKRLAALLDTTVSDAEAKVSAMVSDQKSLKAKMDRPAGIVAFRSPPAPEETLNTWAGNVTKLLTLVETTRNLIHKETMVHKPGKATPVAAAMDSAAVPAAGGGEDAPAAA